LRSATLGRHSFSHSSPTSSRELFKRKADIEMTQVPYRGAGPAFNDLILGRVDVMINFTSSSLPLVRQVYCARSQ